MDFSHWDVSYEKGRFEKVLAKLTNIGNGNYTPNLYTWSGILRDSEVGIEALKINGSDIFKFPLKSADVCKLADNSHFTTSETRPTKALAGYAEVDGSLVTLLPHPEHTQPQILRNLVQNTLENMLNIQFDCLGYDIEAKLEKLVICQEGGSHECSLVTKSSHKHGKIGSIFFKLPVKGKPSCGTVTVNNGTAQTCLKFRSKKKYAVAAVAGGGLKAGKQSYTVKSDAGELTVLLVFSMVWHGFMTLGRHVLPSLTYFPDLLVLTHEIKTMLLKWEKATGCLGTEFLCLPISNVRDEKQDLGFFNLSAQDLTLATSLTAISFLDVNFAWISRGGFKREIFSPLSIKDSLLQSTRVIDRNFIGKKYMAFLDCPAIVIRPRNPSLLLPAPEQTIAELFLESLENSLNMYPVSYVLEKPFLHGRLSKDLEKILKTLEDESQLSKISCQTCLFTRLFNSCIRLDATPQRIMKIFSKLDNVVDFFTAGCADSLDRPANVFFDFMCQTDGWETCSDDLAQLANQLLMTGGLEILSEVGIKLLQSGNLLIANEIYRRILVALEEAPQGNFDIIFHVELVVFAIQMHENNEPELEKLLCHLKHIKPPKLTELVEHLGNLLENKALDCTFSLRKIGHIMSESNFIGFHSEQFFKIIKVYRSLNEEELVSSFWTSMCNQCIEVSNSSAKTNSCCLFCKVLEGQLETEVLDVLSSVTNVKKALISSMKKLDSTKATFNFKVKSHISYIASITSLEERVQLSRNEILVPFSYFYARLKPEDMFNLSNTLFRSVMSAVQIQRSTLFEIHECLLDRICDLEANVLTATTRRVPILESFAWHGDLILLETFVDKLQLGFENGTNGDKQVALLISEVFKSAKCSRAEFATLMMLNRDVFNLLMLKWLKALRSQTERNASLFECFKHFTDGERSFIDSTETNVVAEWENLVGSLSLIEALALVNVIFDIEMEQEGPSLKKFPSCWNVFGAICQKALSMLDPIFSDVSADLLVSLMQSLFWIGEEKGISTMCRLLRNVTQPSLVDVRKIIVQEQLTTDLAIKSRHGILALNDLIDARLQDLNVILTYSFFDDAVSSCRKSNYYGCGYSAPILNLPTLHEHSRCGRLCSTAAKIYLEKLQSNHNWADNSILKKEIDELNALRKRVLEEIMNAQTKANSNHV